MAKVTVFVVIALLGLMDYILIVACARFERQLEETKKGPKNDNNNST